MQILFNNGMPAISIDGKNSIVQIKNWFDFLRRKIISDFLCSIFYSYNTINRIIFFLSAFLYKRFAYWNRTCFATFVEPARCHNTKKLFLCKILNNSQFYSDKISHCFVPRVLLDNRDTNSYNMHTYIQLRLYIFTGKVWMQM